ncbi:MAG: protein-S-isoprenylcysteine O-methyltransferase, partial [Chloroflexi bacterium]|nr:protein-S-isoprenylcysteine O-methyltransferase [Chloroflexota bacterium]
MRGLIIVYWVGLLIEIAIRAPFQKAAKTTKKIEQRISRTEKVLLGLLAIGMLIIPLIYSLTNWLAFANYRLPTGLGWLGIFLLACALLVFARGHMDLKSNWSPTLEIRQDHTLVTTGIYRYIRHQMYASQWLWVIAQILLLQNWLAGPLNLLIFIPFYFLRVPA